MNNKHDYTNSSVGELYEEVTQQSLTELNKYDSVQERTKNLGTNDD